MFCYKLHNIEHIQLNINVSDNQILVVSLRKKSKAKAKIDNSYKHVNKINYLLEPCLLPESSQIKTSNNVSVTRLQPYILLLLYHD